MIKKIYTLTIMAALIAGCGGGQNNGDENSVRFSFDSFETSKTVMENSSVDILLIKTNEENISYFISGGEDKDIFNIDKTAGMLSFKTPVDYENPKDKNADNIYKVTVGAKNDKNETLTKEISVTVVNDPTDDGPVFKSPSAITLEENKKLDFSIVVEDNNSAGFIYIISAGEDLKKFTLNNSTGKLSFNSFIPDFDNPSDFDKDNSYKIVVKAINDKNISNEQNISINITDDPDDLIPSRTVFKTGQDDGPVKGLPFGEDRDFIVHDEIDTQRAVSLGDRMWEDSEHVTNTKLDFDSANDYCDTLDYAGYDDWRAPNRHELAEIINYGKKNVLIDDIFNYKNGGNFWTSQPRLSSTGDNSKAWSISFSDGEAYDEPKGSDFYIRCVRGKEIKDHHDFSVKGDIVIDNKTGLMWQNARFSAKRTWQEAIDYCKKLEFEGYDDWRLPNVNELRTIMPKDGDEILFEDLSPIDMDSGHSWSSTDYDETHARYNLNFWDAESDRDSLIMMYEEWTKDQNNDMMLNRCIRGGHL